ncbi:ATP-binding protein [Mucilaginibacter sp. PAMB04168]|uniref:ATP-binding protein n=1 Tax=Mucilaginibacter sp. PAMB04168 TaxID=3138567 RepID=UPI0031F67E3C
MPDINDEYPTVTQALNSPVALANKPFPYDGIADARRFEELVYSIFKQAISEKSFRDFDEISLMSGVRDYGRDCALKKNGKNYGLIQCKKYTKSLNKSDFGEEIVKFVLYTLLDKTLMFDEEDFEYFICATSNFTHECGEFIDGFRQRIFTEPQLHNWIEKNLKSPTLRPLQITDYESELHRKLSLIKLTKITSQDLDQLLIKKSFQHLIPLFFEVRTITVGQEVVGGNSKARLKQTSELREYLHRGSVSLNFEKDQFEGIPASHISRQETTMLLDWITSHPSKDEEGKDKNICLLSGNAGMGKTVILKDLYQALVEADIAVLALKSDKLYANNIRELQDKLGVGIPVYDLIEQCKQIFKRTVIVIDQIDALSQSMSTDRNYINVYKAIIDRYTHDSDVKIVISVRTFDLHFDPSLRVYRKMKNVIVKRLDEETVLMQLKKIGIEKRALSGKLLDLLRTPNHLNVFSLIHRPGNSSLSATSIQGLYMELWRQNVLAVPYQSLLKPKGLKALLYNVAHQMFKEQRIALSEHIFEDSHQELLYLVSSRLLTRDNAQIQFFHQTFYDFVFAKRFVEESNNLKDYIFSQEQSIHIRSAVKMILTYLREYAPNEYVKGVREIMEDQNVLFHIKHLTLSVIAYTDDPLLEEISLATELIGKSLAYNTVFFEHVASPKWFAPALAQHFFDDLLAEAAPLPYAFIDHNPDGEQAKIDLIYNRNTRLDFLKRQVLDNYEPAWDFLLRTKWKTVIKNVLYDVTNWHNPKAFQVLEQCKDFEEPDDFIYHRILKHVAVDFPEYAWDRISNDLLSDSYKAKSTNRDFHEEHVLKDLAASIPEKMIETLSNIIERKIDPVAYGDRIILDDYHFNNVDLQDEDSLEGPQYIYRLLAVCLRRAAAKRSPQFLAYVSAHTTSKLEPILRLLIFAIKTNESLYAQEIFNLFTHLHDNRHLKGEDDFNSEFREIFKTGFEFLSDTQRGQIIDKLKVLKVKDEAYVFPKVNDRGPVRVSYVGKAKWAYYRCLPAAVIDADQTLKVQFGELSRRFPDFDDKIRSGRTIAGMVRPPLPHQAYERMSEDQWIRSFHKYISDRDWPRREDFLKGGLHEHALGFKEAVTKDPGPSKIRLIDYVLEHNEIPNTYAIYGIWGLTDSNIEPLPEIQVINHLFKRLLSTGDYDRELTVCISTARFLLRNECNDEQVITFLIDLTKQPAYVPSVIRPENDEEKADRLLSRAINDVPSSAAYGLVYVTDPAFEDLIFAELSNLLSKGNREMKAGIYYRYAHLMKLNGERAFELFVNTLSAEADNDILSSAIWSLQYLGNYDFFRLNPIYQKLINSRDLKADNLRNVFSILFFSYLLDKQGADRLLWDMLDQHIAIRRWAITQAAEHYYFNDSAPSKSHGLLLHLANLPEDGEADNSEWRFIKFDHIPVSEIADVLESYISSSRFAISDNLVSYLTDQCSNSPFICIDLFNLTIKQYTKCERKNNLHREIETTKFVIGAFNALKGNDESSKKMRMTLLEAFDTILKDVRLRNQTDKVLEELL